MKKAFTLSLVLLLALSQVVQAHPDQDLAKVLGPFEMPYTEQTLLPVPWGKVEKALAAGANPQIRLKDGTPLIYLAAHDGQLKLVKLLLSKGAPTLDPNHPQNSLLGAAITGGQLEMVEFLLDQGQPLNPSAQMPPLAYAAVSRQTQIAELLIERGARLEAQDQQGNTALLLAAMRGDNLGMLKLLLAKGADIQHRNQRQDSILHLVALSDSPEMLSYLERTELVNARNQESQTPLLLAAASGNGEMIKLLLKQGAEVNHVSKEGYTPLLYAGLVADYPAEAVRLLIQAGAEVNVSDGDGRTPLVLAVEQNDLDNVRLLLQKGADPKLKVKGKTLLDLAKQQNFGEMVALLKQAGLQETPSARLSAPDQKLAQYTASVEESFILRPKYKLPWAEIEKVLQQGANPNFKLKNGSSLVFLAAYDGNLKLVKYLLSKKVDLSYDLVRQLSLLATAVQGGHLPMVAYLIEQGQPLSAFENLPPLCLAASNGQTEIVRLLIAKGADPNLADATLATPIMHAALQPKRLKLVQYLHSQGADLFKLDHEQNTILHYAAFSGDPETVAYLLEKTDFLNTANAYGLTPLMKAIVSDDLTTVSLLLKRGADAQVANPEGGGLLNFAGEYSNNPAIFKLLLESGVDIHEPDREGRSPLYWAVINNQAENVRLLLKKGANPKLKLNAKSLLQEARERGHQEVINLLQQAGL